MWKAEGKVVPLDCSVENIVDTLIQYSERRNKNQIKPTEGMGKGNSAGRSIREVTYKCLCTNVSLQNEIGELE